MFNLLGSTVIIFWVSSVELSEEEGEKKKKTEKERLKGNQLPVSVGLRLRKTQEHVTLVPECLKKIEEM